MNSLVKKAIAEFIGTFVLVFFAVGTACHYGSALATSLAFGLVIVAMAYSIGRISGCHINPAVSLGCLVAKRMTAKEFIAYVIAQVLGAIVGAALLFAILKMSGWDKTAFTMAGSNESITGELNIKGIVGALVVECVLTFIFVYVILNVTDNNATEGDEYKRGTGQIAGIIIGLTLTLVHLIGIGFTGTSVNPARSIGTAIGDLIFSGKIDALKHVWMFIAAPLAGGALAAIAFQVLHGSSEE